MRTLQRSLEWSTSKLNKNSRQKGITLLFHVVNFDTPHLGQFERIDIHLKYIIILHIIHLTFVHGNNVKIKLSDDSWAHDSNVSIMYLQRWKPKGCVIMKRILLPSMSVRNERKDYYVSHKVSRTVHSDYKSEIRYLPTCNRFCKLALPSIKIDFVDPWFVPCMLV